MSSESAKLRLGGMALRNGLLVHGPTHWSAAVRAKDGSIRVASGRKPDFGARATDRVPGVRGVAKLAEAFAVIPLVKRALPEARLPMQDFRTLGAMGGASLVGQALRRTRGRSVACEAALALISMAPAMLALRGGDLASYHGVEHKSIAAYEQDSPDAAAASKEHDRCGSNLVAPMLVSTAAGGAAGRRGGIPGPGGPGHGGRGRGGGAAGRYPGTGGRGNRRARQHRVRGRGLRLVGAPLGHGTGTRAAPAWPRDPAPGRHAGADGRAARGGPGGARRDPEGG